MKPITTILLTDSKGCPLKIQNGFISSRIANRVQEGLAPTSGRKIKQFSPRELSGDKNAYSPEEIGGMIKALKQNGKLKAAIQQFNAERGKAE